jgi:hypothetical protein
VTNSSNTEASVVSSLSTNELLVKNVHSQTTYYVVTMTDEE